MPGPVEIYGATYTIMALLSLRVLELTVYLTKAVTSALYHMVIYFYTVLLLVGRKLNLISVGFSYGLTIC